MTENIDNQPVAESPELLAEPEPVAPAAKTKQTSVAKSAGIVSAAVMVSRMLGLVRETVFAYYFGAGFLYDAYQVAFRIPNVLRDLFAEGALSVAFVKVFTDYLINKSEEEAWRLASMVLNAVAVVLSVITIIGVLGSGYFVSLIAPDFPPEVAALATLLTRIMFPYILLVALSAVAMGVLNTKGIFGIPASASTVFNVTSIIFGLGMAYWLSGGNWERVVAKGVIPTSASQWAIIGMAIGTLMGGGAQFLMQVPSLHKIGFRFRAVLNFSNPGIKQVMRLMTPAILGTSAVQVNVLINTFFVTGIEGGVSWLSYAFRLMQFPIGLFGVAIGTASIPVLSRLATEGKTPEFRDTLSSSINLVFLMTLPSACGLVILGEPIIRLLYMRGAFKESDVSMAAWALSGYAIGLTGYAAIKVLSPAFYALNDAKTPMLIAIGSIVVNAIASYFLMNLLSHYYVSDAAPSGIGHVGVALATSIVALVNFLALAIMMRVRIGRLNGRSIAASFIKIAIASTLLSVSAYASYHFLLDRYGMGSFTIKMVEAFVPITLGAVTFFIVAKLLRVTELEQVFGMVRQKLGR